MHAAIALQKVLTMDFQSVLDIGSGDGAHAKVFRDAGKDVFTASLRPPADFIKDYLHINFGNRFDCIWASHVLEHQKNVNLFLKKCFSDLNDDGILAVTVPPAKHAIVGGHLTLWNAGLLLYNLILAGFDCSEAAVKTYGYNISVIVRKKAADLPVLAMDCGDIEKIQQFFPFPAEQGFDGQIDELNWE